jgi:GNAT superfamily N-acetyltransferase
MNEPDVRPLDPVPWPELEPLIAAAEAEGFRFLARLRDEHASGANRFDAPGEALLGAWREGRLVAVGGLTRCPYSADPRTGRVRHLYVLPPERGTGVGRALMAHLAQRTRPHFDRLVLRTDTAAAARFYERLGFAADAARTGSTHSLDLRTTSPDDPDGVACALLPLVRRLCAGPCAVALGGSHARGSADAHSDVDLYVFASAVRSSAERDAVVTEALGAAAEADSWGREGPFVEGGTDFRYDGRRVEVWLRSTEHVEASIAASLRGEVRRDPSVWAVMGFFRHVVLADVRSMRIVDDPDGVLARWKGAVAEYPEALRDSLVRRFLAEAAFWPENVHYRTAVERADALYTSAIVQQVAQALVQVLFALGREYFPGEKQLAAALETLPLRPPDFARRLLAVLFPGAAPGAAELEAQRRELAALVAETARLAEADRASSARAG